MDLNDTCHAQDMTLALAVGRPGPHIVFMCFKPCRRTVLTSGLAAAVSLPLLGCSEHDVDVLGEDVDIDLRDYPDLQEVGATVFVEVEQLAHPLAVTRSEDDEFIVTGTECNHNGCGVQRRGEGFVCPCHGARFDLNGALRKGPATQGLVAYDHEVNEDILTVFGM